MTPWFIVAQILGAITICFEFASYQIKDKRKYLLVNGIGSAFWATMFLAIALHSSFDTMLSLIVVASYSSVRALVFWWIFAKDTPKRRKAGRIFLVCMLALALGGALFVIFTELPTTETQIIQGVALVFALGFVLGQYLPGKHPVRIAVFLYAIMLFLMQTPLMILEGDGIGRWNIMGMLIEISKMMSVLMFYGILLSKKLLANKLVKIKANVACQMTEINGWSDAAYLTDTGLLKIGQLERLAAKMLRLELSAIDKSEIKDTSTSNRTAQVILDDLKTVNDVKALMEKMIELKKDRLSNTQILQASTRLLLSPAPAQQS